MELSTKKNCMLKNAYNMKINYFSQFHLNLDCLMGYDEFIIKLIHMMLEAVFSIRIKNWARYIKSALLCLKLETDDKIFLYGVKNQMSKNISQTIETIISSRPSKKKTKGIFFIL